MKNQEFLLGSTVYKALYWIVKIFEKHSINYILVGGLAAFFYGSIREINDIDFYIDLEELELILQLER